MNKLSVVTLFLLICSSLFSQAPAGFKYQAVLRNLNGELIVNQPVSVKLEIIKGTIEGQIVYSESHQVNTNEFGLINLNVGQGSTVNSLTSINWGDDNYFLNIEIDLEGGTNYTPFGTVQLLSVPYALYANKANLADTSQIASFAEQSNNALHSDSSGYAIYADTAQFAHSAEQSNYSLLTEYSLHADSSSYSLYSDTAQFARLAEKANHALLSDYSTKADSAAHSEKADTAFNLLNEKYDKQIRFNLGYSANTQSSTWVTGGDLIKFKKSNYVGVDSIIFVARISTYGEGNYVEAVLFNLTTNQPIPNSTITNNTSYLVYKESGNLFNDIPEDEIKLGIGVRSTVSGQYATIYTNPMIILYRRD
jgi:hypothetical protein